MAFLDDAMQRCARECASDPMSCVSDDEIVTQAGLSDRGPKFRNRPLVTQPGMSLERGDISAEVMCEIVHGTPSQQVRDAAIARITTAGRLRAAGFVVIHTPRAASAKSGHATVGWVVDEAWPPSDVWPEEVPELFDTCFNEE